MSWRWIATLLSDHNQLASRCWKSSPVCHGVSCKVRVVAVGVLERGMQDSTVDVLHGADVDPTADLSAAEAPLLDGRQVLGRRRRRRPLNTT